MARARQSFADRKTKAMQPKWYDTHNGALWLGLGSLVAAYFVGSWGIDTGRWLAYFGTLFLLILGFNRLIVAVRGGTKK